MSRYTYWVKKIRDAHNLIVDEKGTKVIQYVYLLIIDEDDTKVVRDLRYVLREWLENCERVDFEDPFPFTFTLPDRARAKEITIRLSSSEEIVVNLDVLVEWYMEHRVKVGLRRLIIDDLKEATDEA